MFRDSYLPYFKETYTGKQIAGFNKLKANPAIFLTSIGNVYELCYTIYHKIVSREDFLVQSPQTPTFWLDEKKISKQKKLKEEIIKYENTYSIKEWKHVIW